MSKMMLVFHQWLVILLELLLMKYAAFDNDDKIDTQNHYK